MRCPLLTTCGVLLSLSLAGCQGGAERTPGEQASVPRPDATAAEEATTPAAADAAGQLTLVAGGPGPHLADGAGSALYALEGDTAGQGCVDVCLEAWPPVLVAEAQPTAAAGLQPNLVSSVQRPDGTRQVTYGNKPLYRYAGDKGLGRTSGHGTMDQWGQWHLVGPDGGTLPAESAGDQG